ncbi:DUF4424 family protein [Methylobacterium sp. Leaf118]|uniref:DUF4424 family protein n=1 Tax=Methylobacterium sp. Leaf118 TaxID=2876562 RepID=UPI001E46F6C0|nr:DUF4424 family protein [Methylobacterium sp. Leaf118]
MEGPATRFGGRRRRVRAALFLIAIASTGTASANDSAAYFGAGGLEFTATDAVTMEREDLRVSQELIEVEYRFRNVTADPVELRAAFPLPRLDMKKVFGCSDVSIPFRGKPDFVGFETRVDGRPVQLERQERAFVGERDISPLLRDLKLPFASTGDDLPAALKRLSPSSRERLRQAGAVTEDSCTDGSDGPAWNLEVVYHRPQRFEAKAIKRVQHRYTPSVGAFFLTPSAKLTGPSDRRVPEFDTDLARYCIDEGTWRALRRMNGGREVVARPLEYILRTARSWRGPIGEFVLVIDKGSADALVSLCTTGVRKTGPTSFEVRRRDYRPDVDLEILFIPPPGN